MKSAWEATVRRLEDGFFTARAEVPGQTGAQFSFRSVDGLPTTAQFFRVQVELDGLTNFGGEIWVVCTAVPTGNRTPPPGTRPFDEANLVQVRSALATALPGATLCFTTEDREGFVRLVGDPDHAPAIAAAVAVVKYFAAWDESDPIDVTVTDDQFAVSVGYSEEEYRASVRRKAAGSQQAATSR